MQDGRSLYAGFYREEVCMQLLMACVRATRHCFGELHARTASDPVVYWRCLAAARQWSAPIMDAEVAAMRALAPLDELLRGSFVVFVQAFYQRPGCPKMQIWLTIPPTPLFCKAFLRSMCESPALVSGCFFAPECALVAKDACMDAVRSVMVSFLSEYTVAHEVMPDARTEASPDPKRSDQGYIPLTGRDADEVRARDSASNVGSAAAPPPDAALTPPLERPGLSARPEAAAWADQASAPTSRGDPVATARPHELSRASLPPPPVPIPLAATAQAAAAVAAPWPAPLTGAKGGPCRDQSPSAHHQPLAREPRPPLASAIAFSSIGLG